MLTMDPVFIRTPVSTVIHVYNTSSKELLRSLAAQVSEPLVIFLLFAQMTLTPTFWLQL